MFWWLSGIYSGYLVLSGLTFGVFRNEFHYCVPFPFLLFNWFYFAQWLFLLWIRDLCSISFLYQVVFIIMDSEFMRKIVFDTNWCYICSLYLFWFTNRSILSTLHLWSAVVYQLVGVVAVFFLLSPCMWLGFIRLLGSGI